MFKSINPKCKELKVSIVKISYNFILTSINRDQADSSETSIESMLQDLVSLTRTNIKRELKNRSDVINKSILRAIKRFFAKEFRSFHAYRRLTYRNKALDHFQVSLKQFAITIGWMDDAELYKLLGFLLDSEMFAEVLSRDGEAEAKEIREFADAFNDC